MAKRAMASQKPKNELPAPAQYNQLRAFLVSKTGLTNPQISAIIGPQGQKNWEEMSQTLRDWLRDRPKAS